MGKKLQPKLRFRGFTDAWEQRELKTLMKEVDEISSDGEILSVTVANGIYPARNGAKDSNPGESINRYKVVRIDDIVYNSMRLWQGAIGISDYKGIVSPAYTVCQVKQGADARFCAYLLRRYPVLCEFYKYSQGNSKDTLILKYPEFSRITVTISPSIIEQHEIANALERIDSLIAAEKRKLNLLQKKKTTLLRQIFEQKLRFKGYSDFWEQHKLGSLGISYSGLSGKTKTDFGHGLASYITYMNVFQNPIADIDSNGQIEIDAKQHTVRYGDALFTISSETPEEVGMSSVWIGNQKNVYLNSFCFGYRQDGAFDVLYLAYMLRSEAVRNQMRMLAQGISRFNISQHKVMDINVNIPSISEQQKIGSFCRGLDQLISAEVKKIDLLTLKKKALLQQMFV